MGRTRPPEPTCGRRSLAEVTNRVEFTSMFMRCLHANSHAATGRAGGQDLVLEHHHSSQQHQQKLTPCKRSADAGAPSASEDGDRKPFPSSIEPIVVFRLPVSRRSTHAKHHRNNHNRIRLTKAASRTSPHAGKDAILGRILKLLLLLLVVMVVLVGHLFADGVPFFLLAHATTEPSVTYCSLAAIIRGLLLCAEPDEKTIELTYHLSRS
uniref:Uncharacterized protein n=1 Tax=Anopheles farauti TaxID=69004 RepID=A0A182QAS5_9DIPT